MLVMDGCGVLVEEYCDEAIGGFFGLPLSPERPALMLETNFITSSWTHEPAKGI